MNDDKNGKPPVAGAEGRYDAEGTRYPKAAVGVHNVILLEDKNGEYQLLMGKRADHLVHGGKWGLIGGYLEIVSGHGVAETVSKETSEETDDLLQLDANDVNLVSAFMDYEDKHNGVCTSIGNRVILRGSRAQAVREFISAGKGLNSEVQCFNLLDLSNIEATLEQLGGVAYGHELRSVLIVRDELQTAKDMQKAMTNWAKEPTLSHQWRPNLTEMNFVNLRDPDITISPTELNEKVIARDRG